MDVVTLLDGLPAVRRPLLVAAFRGWNDAGGAASGAVEALARELGATPFAEIDPEEFFDFQAARPNVRITDHGTRAIEWPVSRFSLGRLPGLERDVVLLDGTEPNLRWRTFCDGVVDLAGRLGVDTLLTLGALQVDVPHTRAVPITGMASDAAVAERLGLRRSSYEGPTGITGVLSSLAVAHGLRSMSMWAGVPHYLAGASYLAGALALVERVAQLLEVSVPVTGLTRDADAQRAEIAALVADDEELAEYVAELEGRVDDAPELSTDPADVARLTDEVERYLRERGR